MFGFKKANKVKTTGLSHHFIFIEVPVDIVGHQAALWGESDWWPRDCVFSYKKVKEGEVAEGTRYRIKIKKPLSASWLVKVEEYIPNRIIVFKFLKGIFRGYEHVKIGERSNGTRIDYELHYRIKGILNMILWPLKLQKEHDRNIKIVLDALKAHCEKLFREQQERNY